MMPQTITSGPTITAPSTPSGQPTATGPSFLDVLSNAGAVTPQSPMPTPDPVTPPPVQEQTPAEPAQEAPKSTKKGLDALLEGGEEQPKAEEKKDEYGDLPEESKPEAKYKWGELKKKATAYDEAQRKIQELEAQVKERAQLNEADPLKLRIKELEERDAAREAEAAKWRIEQTSSWKETIDKPWQNLALQVKDIASRGTDVSPEKIWDILQTADPVKQNEMIESLRDALTPVDFGAFAYRMAVDARQLIAKENELRSNAAAALRETQEREERERSESTTKQKAAEMRAVSDIIEKLRPMAKLFTTDESGAEDAIKRIAAEANETPFSELDTDNKAYAVTAAAALPLMKTALETARREIASLRREIQGLARGAPSVSTGNKTPDAPSNSNADPGASFLSALGWDK